MNTSEDIQRLHCLMLPPHAMWARFSSLENAGLKFSSCHAPGSTALSHRSATFLHSTLKHRNRPGEVLTSASFPCRVANSPTLREVTNDNDGRLVMVFTRHLLEIWETEALVAVVRRTALSAGIGMADD